MMLAIKIVTVLLILGICWVVWMGATSWGTTARSSFDPATGNFAPCPQSPNCVSTQAPQEDGEHFIKAIPFTDSAEGAKGRLLALLQTMPRTKILANEGNYIQTEMRTALMRYVDDVEFFIDEASQTIQFRSGSRIGVGDMGTNRKRMEEIRVRVAGG